MVILVLFILHLLPAALWSVLCFLSNTVLNTNSLRSKTCSRHWSEFYIFNLHEEFSKILNFFELCNMHHHLFCIVMQCKCKNMLIFFTVHLSWCSYLTLPSNSIRDLMPSACEHTQQKCCQERCGDWLCARQQM